MENGKRKLLTIAQKAEMSKCATDPIYFLETYVKIVHPVQGMVPFLLYDHQKDLINAFIEERYNLVLGSRQVGLTQLSCSYLLWYSLFHNDKCSFMLSRNLESAKRLMRLVKISYESLPEWMKTKSKWSKESCELENGSKIIVGSANGNILRGFSFNLLYVDDFSFVRAKQQREFWTSVVPVLSTMGSLIMTSCLSGNEEDLFEERWRVGLNDDSPMNSIKVSWDAIPHKVHMVNLSERNRNHRRLY